MKKTEKAIEWYENQNDETRMSLQKEFGHEGEPDRESKFYQWLITTKKV